MTEFARPINCPECQKEILVVVGTREIQIRLERVAAGASSDLPSSGAPQTPLVEAKKPYPTGRDFAEPTPDYAKTFPQQGSLASVTDQKLSDDLDALPWVWNSKHSGHLTDWSLIAQQTRAALATRMTPEKNETWRYGQYSYNRFRTDKGGELLCRFPFKVVGENK